MRIKNFNINQYKSLKNLKLDNLFDVNIFIGPNNSGKSNILDAIESLFLPFDNSDFFADKKADYSFEIELDEDAKSFFNALVQMSKFRAGSATSPNLPEILTAKRLGGVKRYFLDNAEVEDLKKIEIFFSKRAVRFNSFLVENIKKIRIDYADLKLNYNAEFKNLWQNFHQYFPDIEEMISSEISDDDTKDIKAKLKSGDKIVQFSRLGTGVRRIFVMMLYIFHPKYSIILMNEPEIHLHPALIKKTADMLKLNVKNEQVFLTTHSPVFITPDVLHQVFRVNKDREQNTEVYYFPQNDNINKNRLVQEFNVDNLEMFFADEVVVVEGVSDKILIRGLIDKFYSGSKEIKVVSVSGKDNVGIYIKLMQIFRMPYLVLLDIDALYGLGVGVIREYLSAGNFKPLKVKRSKRFKSRRRRQKLSSSALRQIEELKKHHIYILPNGAIEDNYPRKYQRRDTKPLNALYAASQITSDDFYSLEMANLREVIERL